MIKVVFENTASLRDFRQVPSQSTQCCTSTFVCVGGHVDVHMCVSMIVHVCVYIITCVCACIHTCVCVCVCVCANMRLHVIICNYMQARVCSSVLPNSARSPSSLRRVALLLLPRRVCVFVCASVCASQ